MHELNSGAGQSLGCGEHVAAERIAAEGNHRLVLQEQHRVAQLPRRPRQGELLLKLVQRITFSKKYPANPRATL